MSIFIENLRGCIGEVENLRGCKSIDVSGISFMPDGPADVSRFRQGVSCVCSVPGRGARSYADLEEFEHDAFKFIVKGRSYDVAAEDWDLCSNGMNYNTYTGGKSVFGFDIFKFSRSKPPKKAYYRYVTPVSEVSDCCLRDFETKYYRVGSEVVCSGIEFDIYSSRYFLYTKRGQPDTYLIIDSESEVDRAEFDRAVTAILFAFGFFTTHIYLDDSFVFSSSDRSFESRYSMEYVSIRETINGRYPVFTTNAYSVMRPSEDSVAMVNKYWNGKIPPVSSAVLSAMARCLYDSDLLINAVTAVTDGGNAGPEVQGMIFSGVMEMLAVYVGSSTVSPIDTTRWKTVHTALIKAVDDSALDDREKAFLKDKRLPYLNSLTNNDSLAAPFASYGVHLTDDDLEAIGKRNSFLHGRYYPRSDIKSTDKLLYHCKRLHQLCVILLLKIVGFNGYIIDNPAFPLHHTPTPTEPCGFRLI